MFYRKAPFVFVLGHMRIYSCDVAVIGAGISGMIAAVRSAQGGKRVLVFEKSPEQRYVCNSRITGGIWHCCQRDIQSDPGELEQAIGLATGGAARSDLAKAVASDGIRVVRWMQKTGIRFIKGPYDYQSFMLSPPTLTVQSRQWEGRGGDVMLRTFEGRLVELGGQLHRGHRAISLRKGEDGVLSGFVGESADGKFEVAATHTVIADGGFQANEELIKGPITASPQSLFQRNACTGTGDGLRMAIEAGAASSDMRGFYGHILSKNVFSNEKLWPYAWLDFVAAAGIVVTKSGMRFDDEGLGGVHMANAIAELPDPLSTFVIADENIWKERGTFNFIPPNPNLPNWGGVLHKANSLGELADIAGIDGDIFLREVQDYNSALGQADLERLRPRRSSHKFIPYPIVTAPFFAIPVCAGITYTMGGISIDDHSRVLGTDGRALPGLLAVGCSTGGLEGGKVKGYVGGLVKSSVTGLRAAEHILGILDSPNA